jgi:hypothetical protein
MKIPLTKIRYHNRITVLKVKKLRINGHLLQWNHASKGKFHKSIVATFQTCFNVPSIHARKGD